MLDNPHTTTRQLIEELLSELNENAQPNIQNQNGFRMQPRTFK